MFYKKRIEKLEARVKELELKIKQSECDHKGRTFGADWSDDFVERCWKCKKVLTLFKNEADCLKAKNEYILKAIASNELKIADLEK